MIVTHAGFGNGRTISHGRVRPSVCVCADCGAYRAFVRVRVRKHVCVYVRARARVCVKCVHVCALVCVCVMCVCVCMCSEQCEDMASKEWVENT